MRPHQQSLVRRLRRSSRLRKLTNGALVETNLSASTIHRLCVQAVQLAGMDAADWSVKYGSKTPEDASIP